MARTKKLSAAAKRRALERQEAKLRRDLDKVTDKLAACLVCDAEKLEKEVRSLEQKHTKERNALAKRLGIDPSELKPKATKKKATKKKAAKKKTAKKKATKKKTAKRRSKKKAAKKTAKKASKVSG